MKPSTKTKPRKKNMGHPKRWLSGERAKDFRRRLGATEFGGKSSHVFTFKFPLVAEEPLEQARNELRLQYEKLASIKENSLFHFFVAVHCAGFRLFTSINAARVFLSKSDIAESPFNQNLVERFDLERSAGASLIESLRKEFRNRGDQEPIEEKILGRLLGVREFAKANPKQKSQSVNWPLHKFLQELSQHIVKENSFSGRDNESQKKRLDAACKVAQGQGWTLPRPPVLDSFRYEDRIVHDKKTGGFLQDVDLSGNGLAYAMHSLISYAAHVARGKADNIRETDIGTDIQTILLSDSQNYNALDWLFNPNQGLRFFAESSIDAIRQKLGVSSQCSTLCTIQQIAKKLKEEPIPYKGFRSLFGGHIASYMSNYWKRLDELKKGFIEVKKENATSVVQRLKDLDKDGDNIAKQFTQTSAPIERLDDCIANLVKTQPDAMRALDALMGAGKKAAGKREVEIVETFNERYEECQGMAMQLAEVVRRHYNDKRKKNGEKVKEKKDFSDIKVKKLLPEWLLPKSKRNNDEGIDATEFLKYKLNRYRGAETYSPDEVRQQLEADAENLRRVSEARDRHWEKLKNAGFQTDIVSAQIVTEKERVQGGKHIQNTQHDFLDLACRNIIQRMARVIRNCSGDVRKNGRALFDSHGVFKKRKDANKFFLNGQGDIYVSPFSDRRHEPYPLGANFDGEKKRERTDAFVKSFADWVESLKNDKASPHDLAQLEKCLYALRAAGLQKSVPAHMARPEAGQDDKEDIVQALSSSVRLALENHKDVMPGEMGKIFNAYASKINGLCARLTRERFIVKARLQHIGDNAFYWLPKQGRDWKPPQHVLNGNNPLASGWKQLSQKKLATEGRIASDNLANAVKCLSKMKDKKVFSTCLRQMPHDWYFRVGGTTGNYPMLRPSPKSLTHQPFTVIDNDELLDGLVGVTKSKIALKTKKNDCQRQDYIRISGPSRFKGWLDKALAVDGKQQVSFGDTSLIVEEEYQQSFNGHQPPQVDYRCTRLQVAAVFNIKYNGGQDCFPHGRFIAIDLGERGIGYAVFAIPENTEEDVSLKKVGHVSVPALRHLIHRVTNYRRRTQPRQRFQSNLNTALQQMRETAIGELAGIIDGLMEYHKAFPVFESSVGGFESGGNQLKMVYGSILQLYAFSNVDAHKNKRANHWLAKKDPRWEHPRLHTVNQAKDEAPRQGKKFPLFPGVTVHPAGTSQTCSEYMENPLNLIEKCDINNGRDLCSDDKGILKLRIPKTDGGHNEMPIYIYEQPGRGAKKSARRIKNNALPGKHDLKRNWHFKDKEELKKYVKRMLRHKPLSLRSRDTTQSSYLSPFVDTQDKLSGFSSDELHARRMFRHDGLVYMHADVNAAVNIGRKWWKTKVWHDP